MEDSLDIQSLQRQRYRILGEIASLGDLRPGRLYRRFHRCGKPTCHCQEEGDPGHGPYFVLQFSADGRQTTRSIPAQQADTVRAQTEEYQRLCRLHRELIAVSERLCKARLAAGPAGEASDEDKKKACASEFAAAVEVELERFASVGSADSLDFEAVETCLRRKALQEAARLLERRMNADRGDQEAAQRPCPCGGTARFAGRHGKTFESALGPVRLERAYYHCRTCGHGRFPRDAALGMASTDLSPAVQRMAATAAATVSFAGASTLLDDLAGVQVGTKHVERTAEAIGREIAREEARAPERPAPAPSSTVYLGLDGTGIPVRKSETAGRAGKQPDGSARTREVKLIVIWTADKLDEEGRPVRDPGSVIYAAAIESAASRDTDPAPSAFSQRVRREADRCGFSTAARQVVLGDGAAWIWRLAAEQFPRAIQIVDLFHAKERLWDVAKALHAGDRERIEQWAEARCDELDRGSFHALPGAVDARAASCEEAARCAAYFRNNRNRMRYPEFRAQGLCVGSGVVEAGCKTAIGDRLKRSGMHWSVAGANAILALRCSVLSGRFEDFWAGRCTAPTPQPA